MFDLLGPKTEADLAPVVKEKKKVDKANLLPEANKENRGKTVINLYL